MKKIPLEIIILIFSLILFSFGAQKLSLEFKGDENFYYESAREMLKTGDLVTPWYRGEARFQKPILFYWLIAGSFKIFGINWFAARLPSIIFGSLLVLLVFSMSNLLFKDKSIGFFASVFLATTPIHYRYTKLAIPDITLLYFMALALYFFLKIYKNRSDNISGKLFFLSLALAFLVKGPVGVAIPLIVASAFCAVKRERPFSLGGILAGIIIFFLVITPWFYLIFKKYGNKYASRVWVREILHRLGYSYSDSFIGRTFKNFAFYTEALISRFLPYSLFLPIAFVNSSKVLAGKLSDKDKNDEKNGHLFLILWTLIVFIFFIFVAEKRTHYLLALAPPASILLGAVFKKAISDKEFFSRPLFKLPYYASSISLVIFAVAFIFSEYIFGDYRITAWKLALAVIPLIAALGFRHKDGVFMPLSLVLSLSILYTAMTFSTPFGFFMNRMERAAAMIKSEFKEGDRIGIGSHGIIPEELQAYFESSVENCKAVYNLDGSPNLKSAAGLREFLKSDGRIFCVIKRRDYENFVPDKIKENLHIIGSYYVWKRRIRLDGELEASYSESHSIRDVFQNEIYVIGNSVERPVIR